MAREINGRGKVFVGGKYVADVFYHLWEFKDAQEFKDISGQIKVDGDDNLIFDIFDI